MTFERPVALILVAAVPIAWWLHRNRRTAVSVRVASLLAFRGASDAAPASASRRALDVTIVLVLAAMTLLAVAAAGPNLGDTRPPAFYVVIDGSISTTARTCDAVARAKALLAAAAPDAERVERPLGTPGESDGLPASLAPHLDAARAAGFPGLVLVTDFETPPLSGVALVGPSFGAAANSSIVSASLAGDEAVVAIRNYGPGRSAVRVRSGEIVREAVIEGGSIVGVRFPAPASGSGAEFVIDSPDDDLAADDRLAIVRQGGARALLSRESDCPRLAAAVRAAASGASAANEVDVRYADSIDPPRPRQRLLFVAPSSMSSNSGLPAGIGLSAAVGEPVVRGDEIAGAGEFADVLPSSSTVLVASRRLVGGEAIWFDREGVLIAAHGDLVVIAADPEDARSDWHRDPSFPALVASVLERLSGGPDRLAPVARVPAGESDVVRPPGRTSGADELRAVLRAAGDAPGSQWPERALSILGAALLAAAALLRSR